jgi:signal transduction histidine kinase/ActR/RegA family two-component response regulator
MKVRAYLALIAAAILVPVTVFSAASLQTLMQEERQSALHGVRETARATAIGIDREVASTMAALRVLATSPHLAMGNLPEFHEQARAANSGEGSWTVLFDRAGRQLINTGAPFGAELPRRRHPERGEEVMRTKKPYVSDVTNARLAGRYVVAIDVPVPLDGGRRYVAAQSFFAEYFERAFPQRGLPADWTMAIFDRQGNTIARSRAAPEVAGKPVAAELAAAARAAGEGVLQRHANGADFYDVYTQSATTGWTVAVSVPVQSIEASAHRAVGMLGLGLLAALACATAAAVFLGRRLVRSIGRAAASAAALGRCEQPAAALSGVAELDALHQAIGEAGALLARERASRELAERERAQLYAREQEARKSAESQNRAKDEFIAMLGHELRNPLSAITAANALLNTEELGEESMARSRGVITRQSQPTWIDADRTRVEQIVNNLLINAAKYTPAGGRIEVEVRAADGDAELTVRDSGVGISAQLLPTIFDVFVQGPAPVDFAQSGLGIGLALVRRLVRLHGGSVLAASAGDGQGSTFTVRLPLAVQLPGEAPDEPRTAAAGAKCKVLLIDDNEDGRQTLATILAIHGHQVLEAGDGTRGIALAESGRPDVAVVDIGLPGIDGYEIARRLLAAPQTRHIRLIALTGFGQPEDRRRALDAGFDMYLVKPVEPARLVDAISTMNHARL